MINREIIGECGTKITKITLIKKFNKDMVYVNQWFCAEIND